MADGIRGYRQAQLPLQMVVEVGRFRQKVLKGGALGDLARHLGAIAGIQVVVEKASKVDLFKGIGGIAVLRVGDRDDLLVGGVGSSLFLGGAVLARFRDLGDFLQYGVFHELLGDHFSQFELVERQDADHLNQAGGQHLLLSRFEVEPLFQKSHGCHSKRKFSPRYNRFTS